MAPEARSDAEVRAEDQARVGGGPVAANDAVERRAVGASGNVVTTRVAAPDANVPRAETRGIYLDQDRRRRVVGQGQPIPDGWERVQSATLEDRADEARTNLEDGEQAGGASDDARASTSRRSRRTS